ncbi:histone-lysine N-methyltransferase SETMAR [Trichonephila clavipes]|nr:histone-lysine N-methyltransferase SETMAR [Trichonephila clavipes]
MAVVSISPEVSIKQFPIYARCQDATRTGRPVVENVDKIKEIIEVDWPVNSRSIAQELKIDHETEFKPFVQSWIQEEARCLGATTIDSKKHDGSNFHLRSLAKRNEINPFLKRMMTGDEKWVTYDSIVPKRSWSKCGEVAQTVAKLGQTAKNVLLCIWWD